MFSPNNISLLKDPLHVLRLRSTIMRSLSHLLAVLTAVDAVSAMNIGYPIAQRTSPSVPLEDYQGTSPAPTDRPVLRFRNAHVARQQQMSTCGFISDQRFGRLSFHGFFRAASPLRGSRLEGAVSSWLAIGCSSSCITQDKYIGCETPVYTACYPASSTNACGRGGYAGSRDLCW